MIGAMIFNVFTGHNCKGNPAAAIELTSWLTDAELLTITQQSGQPVTGFVIKEPQHFQIRWFSQMTEINLCGHGTLAAAALVFDRYSLDGQVVDFKSEFGTLSVEKSSNGFSLWLPSWVGEEVEQNCTIAKSLNIQPEVIFKTRDLVVVLNDEQQVKQFQPDLSLLANMDDYHALIVTEKGINSDYVLRYFAPKIGIDEDPATGSAQCSLAAYWFDLLGKTKLSVLQLSKRGGAFKVEQDGKRIKITAEITLAN